MFFSFLFQNWEAKDASGVQAGVWSRCKEKRKRLQHDCQGQGILVCLNALSSNKLKNRSFVFLAAIQASTVESTPQTGSLSVLFQQAWHNVTEAMKTDGISASVLAAAQALLG